MRDDNDDNDDNDNDDDTHPPWIIVRVGMIFRRGQKRQIHCHFRNVNMFY